MPYPAKLARRAARSKPPVPKSTTNGMTSMRIGPQSVFIAYTGLLNSRFNSLTKTAFSLPAVFCSLNLYFERVLCDKTSVLILVKFFPMNRQGSANSAALASE